MGSIEVFHNQKTINSNSIEFANVENSVKVDNLISFKLVRFHEKRTK